MNVNHLKYFVDVLEMGGISKAAEANFVSQSAVSQAIRALESEFGVSLLRHKRKVLDPTPQGELLARRAGDVLTELEGLKHELKGEPTQEKLVIACSNSFAQGILPETLACLPKDQKPPRVILGNSDVVKTWMDEGRAAMGIVVDDGQCGRFSKEVLHEGEWGLIHPVGKEDFPSEGLIVTRKEKREVRMALTRLKRALGHHIGIRQEILSWEAIKAMVIAGNGIGLVPDHTVKPEIEANLLAWKPIPDPVVFKLLAIWPKGRGLSPGADRVMRAIKWVFGDRLS